MIEEGRSQPVVGILLNDWFDEWLDSLGMSLDTFANHMMGSWVFNYVQALQAVGVRSVLVCVSTQVSTLTRVTHCPTGATILILPPSRMYQIVKRWLPKPLESAAGNSFPTARVSLLKRARMVVDFLTESYLATPFIALFRELQHEGCRSLLVQDYESVRFDLCVLFARLKHVQVCGTFTGALPHKWFLRPLRRLALGLCAGLAIGARIEAERVQAQYRVPDDRVSLIYSPVDLGIFYPSPKDQMRASLGIPALVKLAIYHGRIELQYKGLDVLLDAWKQLCENRGDQEIRLLLIGTGSDAVEFGKLLSTKKLPGVEWLNQWVHDRGLIRRYLSAADVYVFPSRGDVCPNAVIEAMACGLPIVASNVNGIEDLLEGGEQSGGLLVPPGDARALAEALGRVFDNQALTCELGRRARCRVEKCFSMEAVGKQLSVLLLSGRP
jgi:glycosyltransferase involved in cell wall biosynthesis